jgi:hypothetical protein
MPTSTSEEYNHLRQNLGHVPVRFRTRSLFHRHLKLFDLAQLEIPDINTLLSCHSMPCWFKG